MALNREQILELDVTGQLANEYAVEAMQNKHTAAVAGKRLEMALDANDELQAEVDSLNLEVRALRAAAAAQSEDVVQGDLADEAPVDHPVDETVGAEEAPKKPARRR